MERELVGLLRERRLREYTRRALAHYGLRPSRKLGQHFIVSWRVIQHYITSIRGASADVMMEIGTGLGTLTYFVASECNTRLVVTTEVDKRLYSIASEALAGLGNVVAVLGDGVRLLESARVPLVFSSTPYSLSSEIVMRVVRNNSVRVAVLGLQKEVAYRLKSEAGSEDYGRLSVLPQLLFDIKMLGVYPPSSFYPKPEVSGALVVMLRKRDYSEAHMKLERLTECLFSQKNKLARKVLEECLRRVCGGSSLGHAEVPASLRVRDLDPATLEKIAMGCDGV